MALASSPSWWGFTVNPDVNSNYAPANLGQLKYMAAKAKMHLDASLFGGAGSDIDDLIAGFGPANGSTYTQAELDANYAPANLGQIKYVAKAFLRPMNAAGFDAIGYLKPIVVFRKHGRMLILGTLRRLWTTITLPRISGR